MGTAPLITIYVRHSAGCKYEGEELARRCDCRKWLRWTQHGVRQRRKANTRSWAEAERIKREIEDQLAGRVIENNDTGRGIRSAIELFISKKKIENVSSDLIVKYELWLGRLASYCEAQNVFAVSGINGEIVIGFTENWEELYPSQLTRQKLRERYKSFMRFCQEQGYITRLPAWPKMETSSDDEDENSPTMPLTDNEYNRLLDAVYVIVKAPENAVAENQTYAYWTKRVRGLFLLMRWSGLSIMDALTLRRSRLFKRDGGYHIETKRTKTKTPISVTIPPHIAEELLAIPNDNPIYFFWSGNGSKKSICGNWGKRFIVPAWEEAGIENEGHMRSHRLRDTFACGLLQKGVSLDDVSKLLGHTSVRMTEKHYAAWVPGRQKRLDNVVQSTWDAPAPKKARPSRKPTASAALAHST